MRLSKPVKILVGLASVWIVIFPILFMALWVIGVFGIEMSARGSYNSAPSPLFGLCFLAIFPLQCLYIFLQIGTSAFYLVHVIKNDTAIEVVRVILGVGVFYMPFLAMPIYFLIYIWPDETPQWARRVDKMNPPPSQVIAI
jgi:hypothetical protein